MTDTPIPVIFIHGLWLHPLSWTEWAEEFGAAGYRPVAPGWPGVPDTVDAARANPDSIANHGIDDVTSHLATAAIAIDAAQIKGVLPLPLPSLRSTLPVFRNPANKHLAVSLTAEQFRYSFGNAIDPGESDTLYEQWAIPAPGRPLFEAAAANFSLHSPAKVNTTIDNRGPLLLIMGGQDHTVPEAITKSTLKQYRHSHAVNDLIEFPDRGHSLTIDHGWRDVATACLDWLYKNSLS